MNKTDLHDANLTPGIFRFFQNIPAGATVRLDVSGVRALWIRQTPQLCTFQFGDVGHPIEMGMNPSVSSLMVKLPGPVDRIYIRNGVGANQNCEFYYSTGEDFAILAGPVPT
jgi:hypothetical protein